MTKALFLDLDMTLCNTAGADAKVRPIFADYLGREVGLDSETASAFARDYLTGIYRELPEHERFEPITDENRFRLQLIEFLLQRYCPGLVTPSEQVAKIQHDFDDLRYAQFEFFPGVRDFLTELRDRYTLVVITNGPEFSQQRKIDTVSLDTLVDHVLIGGTQPHQKPHPSIFHTALELANCPADEAIHIGDSERADIAGAKAAGIHAVLIAPEPPAETAADLVLPRLIDLRAVLDERLTR